MSQKTSRRKRKLMFGGDSQVHVHINTDPLNTDRTRNLAVAAMRTGERKHNLFAQLAPMNTGVTSGQNDVLMMDPSMYTGGGGYVPPPAPVAAPAPVSPVIVQSSNVCTGPASLTEGTPTSSSAGYTQRAVVGPNVYQGYQYSCGVYSVNVSITAMAGDTPASIAQRLADAINNTSLATWMQSGSDNHSFKPSASASGSQLTTMCDTQHSFFFSASGSCPVIAQPTPAPAPAYAAPSVSVAAVNDITLPTNVVQLDGSASRSNNGGTLAYAWTKVNGGAATADNPSAATTALRGLAQGTYTIRLTVTDSVSGQTAYQDVSFSVNPEAQLGMPVVVIQPIDDITLPTNFVALDGTASHAADGSALTYQWTKTLGGNAVADNATTPTTRLTGLEAGAYTIRLTVTDRQGDQAFKEISFSVNPPAPSTLPAPQNQFYSGMPMMGAGAADSNAAGMPMEATKPPYNWIWFALGALVVGYALFSKEGGQAAPLGE